MIDFYILSKRSQPITLGWFASRDDSSPKSHKGRNFKRNCCFCS